MVKLPEGEQHYLRSENIESDHDVESEFYSNQIDIIVGERLPEKELMELRYAVNNRCKSKRGDYLYAIHGKITEIAKNLNRPIFWIEKELNPTIDSYNFIFIESLNVDFLKKEILNASPDEKLKKLGSLKLLEKWFEKVLRANVPGSLACPFYVLYDFRLYFAHLGTEEHKSDDLNSICQRLGLNSTQINFEEIYNKIIEKLIESFDAINGLL